MPKVRSRKARSDLDGTEVTQRRRAPSTLSVTLSKRGSPRSRKTMTRKLVRLLDEKGPMNSLHIEAVTGWESLTVHQVLWTTLQDGTVIQDPPGIFRRNNK